MEALRRVQECLKQMPGLGYRSAERLALHLLVEKPDRLDQLIQLLSDARGKIHRCPITGNLTESEYCPIYSNPNRCRQQVCVVETIPDCMALERSESFQGTYHVLHGTLSPLKGIGPDDLNMTTLRKRVEQDHVTELVLALSNTIEAEATCHFIRETLLEGLPEIAVTRIGFGLPSGSGVTFADPATLRNALESRKAME